MSLTLIDGPAEEPLTELEVNQHLRLGDSASDPLVPSLIIAARQYVETFQNRALIEQVWRLTLDRFPCADTIDLPRPTLMSVRSVEYVDTAGATQTLEEDTDYTVDTDAFPGRILLPYGRFWPATRCQRNAVTIEFVCGYGDACDVPAQTKAAMKLLVGELYENREASIVGTIRTANPTIDALLWPDRYLEAG